MALVVCKEGKREMIKKASPKLFSLVILTIAVLLTGVAAVGRGRGCGPGLGYPACTTVDLRPGSVVRCTGRAVVLGRTLPPPGYSSEDAGSF